jgi:acetyl esterase/lipase
MSAPQKTLQDIFPKTTHIFSPPHTSLDLFLPHSPSPPHKTYVHFHGGGLVRGTRGFSLPEQILTALLQNSWAVVSADYSLLPQGTAADILADLLALETWLLTNPEIDVNNIAVGGRSAGGYVASLAAGNWTKVRPKAVLDLFGMVDLAGEYWTQKKSGALMIHGCETEGLKEEQFAELLGSEEVKSFAEIVIGLGGERSLFFLWSIKEGIPS